MKLPGGMDLGQMMQQAKQMQEDLQREMQQIRVEASAGGGIVHVEMNGMKQLLELKIEPDVVKSGDTEMLQDLLIAAINEASRKVDEAMKGKLGSKLGGLGLPDGLF
jgi:DNA-binding YbaB/EbfC family protein